MVDPKAGRQRGGPPPAVATRAGHRERPGPPGRRARPRRGSQRRTRRPRTKGRARSRRLPGAGRPRATSPALACGARLVARDGFARLAEPVTHAPDRLDQLLFLSGVELAPQRVDVDVDDVRREVERVLPDPRLDLGAGDDFSAPPEEQLEESALAGGQPDDL